MSSSNPTLPAIPKAPPPFSQTGRNANLGVVAQSGPPPMISLYDPPTPSSQAPRPPGSPSRSRINPSHIPRPPGSPSRSRVGNPPTHTPHHPPQHPSSSSSSSSSSAATATAATATPPSSSHAHHPPHSTPHSTPHSAIRLSTMQAPTPGSISSPGGPKRGSTTIFAHSPSANPHPRHHSVTSIPAPPPTLNTPDTMSTLIASQSNLKQEMRQLTLLEHAAELQVKFVDTNKTNITDEDRQAWKRFRSHVAHEILSTEQSYVSSLQKMIEVYHDPYMRGERNTGMSDKKIDECFKLIKIIKNVAETFLTKLKPIIDKWDDDEDIASIFIQFYPLFKTYKDFAAQHQQSISPLLLRLQNKSTFMNYQEKMQKQHGALTLSSYLIMPIQRLPRYKLLLESLISKTPEAHPHAQQLLDALRYVGEVAHAVNDAMKAAEAAMRFIEIQAMFDTKDLVHVSRKVLHEIPAKVGRLWQPSTPRDEKKGKDKREKRHKYVGEDASIFIFTDCVWVGIRTKDREQMYQKSRGSDSIYPIFAEGYAYKYSYTNIGLHSVQTPENLPYSLGDYIWDNTLILTSPVHALGLSFGTEQARHDCVKKILTAKAALDHAMATSQSQSVIGTLYIEQPPSVTSPVLCCDRCQRGLYNILQVDDIRKYIVSNEHLLCSQCNLLVCLHCTPIDVNSLPKANHAAEQRNEAARQIISHPHNAFHMSYGEGISTQQARSCTECELNPKARKEGKTIRNKNPSSGPKEALTKEYSMSREYDTQRSAQLYTTQSSLKDMSKLYRTQPSTSTTSAARPGTASTNAGGIVSTSFYIDPEDDSCSVSTLASLSLPPPANIDELLGAQENSQNHFNTIATPSMSSAPPPVPSSAFNTAQRKPGPPPPTLGALSPPNTMPRQLSNGTLGDAFVPPSLTSSPPPLHTMKSTPVSSSSSSSSSNTGSGPGGPGGPGVLPLPPLPPNASMPPPPGMTPHSSESTTGRIPPPPPPESPQVAPLRIPPPPESPKAPPSNLPPPSPFQR